MIKLLQRIRLPGRHSLKVRMLYALMLGAVLAVLVFIATRSLGNALIGRLYLSDAEREKRELAYVSELQGYIERNELTSNDGEALASWARDYKYLYVMIHKEDQLLFESPDYDPNYKPPEEEPPEEEPPAEGEEGAEGAEPDKESGSTGGGDFNIIKDRPTREELIKYAEERGAHLLTMGDGNVLVSVAEFTEYLYYNVVNIGAMGLAFLMLVLVLMLYVSVLTRRITSLAGAVTKVAEGDISHSIPTGGNDELAGLSSDVENMRSSLVQSLAGEREAMRANSQLITAMSHDVRTPLTVLLGYLDIMKSSSEDEQMQEYIGASESMALRLKELTDDLFNYFLVFGQGAETVQTEECDAVTLLGQIFSEYQLLLKEQGYTIEADVRLSAQQEERPLIRTDATKLVRLFGNVMSNVMKYADKSVPVSVFAGLEQGLIRLAITNGISRERQPVESNGIGLKTCYKLAELLEMTFRAEEMGDLFTVEISIPVVNNVNK